LAVGWDSALVVEHRNHQVISVDEYGTQTIRTNLWPHGTWKATNLAWITLVQIAAGLSAALLLARWFRKNQAKGPGTA